MVVLAAVQITIGAAILGMGFVCVLAVIEDTAGRVLANLLGFVAALSLVVGGLALLQLIGVIHP